jgi:hypothetical protein
VYRVLAGRAGDDSGGVAGAVQSGRVRCDSPLDRRIVSIRQCKIEWNFQDAHHHRAGLRVNALVSCLPEKPADCIAEFPVSLGRDTHGAGDHAPSGIKYESGPRRPLDERDAEVIGIANPRKSDNARKWTTSLQHGVGRHCCSFASLFLVAAGPTGSGVPVAWRS